jgi:pimeloyl-ACP methyl ester carboxylesterase
MDVSGPNWHVQTHYELWSWDDIVRENARRSSISRLVRGAITYADLLFSGTLYRYLKGNYRYFIFSIVPLLQIVLFVGVAWFVGWFIARFLGLNGSASSAVTFAVGLTAFFLLVHWPGQRWRMQQAFDDWIFSREYLQGRRADMEVRLEQFAKALVERVQEHKFDEIIVVGHSLGALFAIEIVARALARGVPVGDQGAPIGIVTLGATIPKCTLHPDAGRIRERVMQIVKDTRLHWVEFQSRRDAISFYKLDPAALQKVNGDQLNTRPMIRHVRMNSMLSPETFARYRFRILRLHYQSVMANERRAVYDYLMMCCGPLRFARWTVSPRGLLDFINPDGSVSDARFGNAR